MAWAVQEGMLAQLSSAIAAGYASSMSKTVPKQKRALQTYNAILDCVEQIIMNSSSEKLTPRAVVLATGVPQGTLYRYFSDVSEMRDALFERYMIKFREDVRQVYQTAHPADVIGAMETLFELILDLNRANPVLLTLSLDPTTQSRARAVVYQRELIATCIADALVEKGLISDYDKLFLDNIYLCVLVSASLTKEAFLWDPAGDEFVIDAGRQIIRRQAEVLSTRSTVKQDVEPEEHETARKPQRRKTRHLKHVRGDRKTLRQR